MKVLKDERGVVIDWLVKLLIFLSVLGIVGYDVVSIVTNTFTLDSSADDTAVAISTDFRTDQFGTNDDEVFQRAEALVATGDTGAADATVVQELTNVDENGVVHVTLRRTAKTLVVRRIAAIRNWATATAEGTASTN